MNWLERQEAMENHCEVCECSHKLVLATKRVNRRWHTGELDPGILVCNIHSESDPDGVWTMEDVEDL